MIGSGTIGIMMALAALAGGCARVIVSDLVQEKLDIVGRYKGVTTINGQDEESRRRGGEAHRQLGRRRRVRGERQPEGVSTACSISCGRAAAWCSSACRSIRCRSTSSARQVKEARIETIFRYANVHARAIELIASGKVDLKPLISGTFPFEQSIEAIKRAASGRPGDVKLQIKVPGAGDDLTPGEAAIGKPDRRCGAGGSRSRALVLYE